MAAKWAPGLSRCVPFQVGWYVTLHVVDVPSSVMESVQSGRPLTLVSLLPHEQKVKRLTGEPAFPVPQLPDSRCSLACVKMSVMHVLVRRHPSNTEPIKSKEELVFHCGFRRFRASPIFSQHTSGCRHCGKKKCLREVVL